MAGTFRQWNSVALKSCSINDILLHKSRVQYFGEEGIIDYIDFSQ